MINLLIIKTIIVREGEYADDFHSSLARRSHLKTKRTNATIISLDLDMHRRGGLKIQSVR